MRPVLLDSAWLTVFLVVALLALALQAVAVVFLVRIHSSLSARKNPSDGEPETPAPEEPATAGDTAVSGPAEEPASDTEPPAETKPAEESGPADAPAPEEAPLSEKERVLAAVRARSVPATDEDLPRIREELSSFFSLYAPGTYGTDPASTDYYRFLDLRNRPDTRVVIVGDIHSDPASLAAVLLKLSVSDYDYFGNAFFVFLGDYFDRGTSLFETLLLLMDLKRVLGERMILLKGNHESLEWDAERRCLTSRVIPHQSTDCLNLYFKGDEPFLRQLAAFYGTLPIYVYVKTDTRNVLLTHASIPRDIFHDKVRLDGNDGSLTFTGSIPPENRLGIRNRVFKDMIWGDPSPFGEKIQVEGRFEFGSRQFDRWTEANGIDLLVRSHEETEYGVAPYFGDRLYTVFSTGGDRNDFTGYPRVEPAFGVLQGDRIRFESSFVYRVRKGSGCQVINALSKKGYSDRQAGKFFLQEEYICMYDDFRNNRSVFKRLSGESVPETNE